MFKTCVVYEQKWFLFTTAFGFIVCMFISRYGSNVVSSYGFSISFWNLLRLHFFCCNGATTLQDTALDLHNELLLWYVCEDAEASGYFYWGFGVWGGTDCAEKQPLFISIHGVFSSMI